VSYCCPTQGLTEVLVVLTIVTLGASQFQVHTLGASCQCMNDGVAMTRAAPDALGEQPRLNL